MNNFTAHNQNASEVRITDDAMTQTPEERTLTQLEVQYKFILLKLEELPDQITKTVNAAIDSHTIACINQKKKTPSIPPPRISEKGWETIKYIATLIAASAIGSGGLAGIQHFIK